MNQPRCLEVNYSFIIINSISCCIAWDGANGRVSLSSRKKICYETCILSGRYSNLAFLSQFKWLLWRFLCLGSLLEFLIYCILFGFLFCRISQNGFVEKVDEIQTIVNGIKPSNPFNCCDGFTGEQRTFVEIKRTPIPNKITWSEKKGWLMWGNFINLAKQYQQKTMMKEIFHFIRGISLMRVRNKKIENPPSSCTARQVEEGRPRIIIIIIPYYKHFSFLFDWLTLFIQKLFKFLTPNRKVHAMER